MPQPARKPSTYVDFKAVKAAVSIEAVLERYELLDDLNEKDDGYTGDCPFHKGETPRPFHVSTSKNAWYCFGCEEGGNVLDFVARMEDVSIKKAAQLLAEWFEVKSARKGPKRARSGPQRARAKKAPGRAKEEPQEDPHEAVSANTETAAGEETPDSDEEPVNRPLGFSLKNLDPSHERLTDLGFEESVFEHFEAGYCSKGMMKGRLAIPIHSPTGELLAYAGRALGDEGGYKFPPKFDRSLELYNLHRAIEPAKEQGLILVESVLDVWRLHTAGFHNAVALMAGDMDPRQEALVTSFAGDTQRVVVLGPESDRRDALVNRLLAQVFVKALELDEDLG